MKEKNIDEICLDSIKQALSGGAMKHVMAECNRAEDCGDCPYRLIKSKKKAVSCIFSLCPMMWKEDLT